MKKLTLLILFIISVICVKAQIQKGTDIDGEAGGDRSGAIVCMPDDITVAIGAYNNAGNGMGAGHVRIYRWNGTTWVQKGEDIDGEAAGDNSSSSISMPDANTVAIGAQGNDGNGYHSGHVRIYNWDDSTWVQKGEDIDGEADGDYSGGAVSMPNPNTVAIGAEYNNGNGTWSGHVRVYEWNGIEWLQKGADIDGESVSDNSGTSVSMPDANTIAIGSKENDGIGDNAGHVRVYSWSGSTWVQKGTDIDGEAIFDNSGGSISMPDANTLAIGAPGNDGNGSKSGHVRIYFWNGSDWQQKGIDIEGEAPEDFSGFSVSMPNANTVAIGAYLNDGNGSNAGHVRVYFWSGSVWQQKGIDIEGEAPEDFSGYSVSMPSTNTIAIGAHNNDGNGSLAGHVRVYSLKGVSGFVYNDSNQNCSIDTSEYGVVSGITGIIIPGNIVVQTNSSGTWSVDSLPTGTYTISYDTNGNWKSSCSNQQIFTIANTNISYFIDPFGMHNSNPCVKPEVSIIMPFMRPCFTGQKIYVRGGNSISASKVIDSAFVLIELDTLINVTGSTIPYTMRNSKYCFKVGDLLPGKRVDFTLDAEISCNVKLGQTLCMEADLFPVESCALDAVPADTPPDFTPCSIPWDRSSISVEGWCKNDSIYFTITNTGDAGDGDMQCFSPMRLYIDGKYIWLDSIQLAGQQTDTLVFSGDGRTWRLEVDQHPLHPGNSHPNASVELCGGDSNWTPNLINILPHDDLDPVSDIYCGVVTGSYDPNDKTGYPLGITDTNFVSPNGKMEYLIRFQNTGTDTAFTVVIRDTLDEELNIYSLTSGVSSHDYKFKIYGPRVLEWNFNNILLPDSGSNQEESNGFVTFSVMQNKGLPEGTDITNEAGIYFDYNAPIITNQTSHVIKRTIRTPSWAIENQISDTSCTNYQFRSMIYVQSGNYYRVIGDTLYKLNFSISEIQVVANVSDSVICIGDTIIFNGLGAKSYSWDKGVVDRIPFLPNFTLFYHLTGIDNLGCTDKDSVKVIVNILPSIEAGKDSGVCFNETIVLSGSGGQNYSWNKGVVNGVGFAPSNSQTYTVVGVDSNGCENMDSVLVEVFPLPNVKARTDTSICFNEDITLSGSGANNYLWNNEVSDGVRFYPTNTKFYTVKGTDNNGCVESDSVQVIVIQSSINAGTDTLICMNEAIILSVTGVQTYTWENGVINGASFVPSETQTYVVTGIDTNGCEGIDSVFVFVYDTMPVSNFAYYLTKGEISLVDSSSNDVNSWFWSINGDSTTSSNDFDYVFTQNGTFEICLIASNDCFSDTLCQEVKVTTLGIEHTLEQGRINVYPNPVQNVVNFDIQDLNQKVKAIQFVDANGRVIHYDVNNVVNSTLTVDISQFTMGVYFYEIIGESNVFGVGKIVKE